MKMLNAVPLFLISFLIINTSTAQNSRLHSQNKTRVNIEKLYLQTDRDYYFLGDTIWFKAYLLDGQCLSPVSDVQNLNVELIDSKGSIFQNQVFLCQYGLASGSIWIADTSATGPVAIRAYTDYQKNFGADLFFHKTIRISEVKNSFEIESEKSTANSEKSEIDVSFFPEGGFLLAGTQSLVAFKAVDKTGKGVSIQGVVLDSHRNGVVAFKTDYKGMGRLSFNPEEEESYEIIIDGYPGFTYRFDDIRSEAMKLVLLELNQEELTLKILSNSRKRSREPFYVACFSRDSLLFNKEITRRGTMKLKVETDVMLGGVNRFILLNEELEPVSERLVFLDNLEIIKLELKTKQTDFATRSPVHLDILDDQGILDSAYSSLSISVVNENALIAGGDHQHMASYLFLDSELHGNIESPADYFVEDEYITSKDKLNLLMLTNGWCNYRKNLSEVNSDDFEYQKTAGITIKGNAERIVGKKPIVGGAITVGLFKDSANIILESQTDSSGWFSIDSLFFFDTVTIFAQVLNERGKQRTEVHIDTVIEKRPAVSPHIIDAMHNISDIPLEQYRQKYYSDVDYREYHPDDGSILLEEVEIKRRKVDNDDERFRMYLKEDGNFRLYLRADDVLEVTPSDYHHASVLQFLKGRVAGFSMDGGGPRLRGAGSIKGPSTPLFILDGMLISEMPMNIINSIPMSNIDKVEVLKGGSAAIYGSRGANGVIAIYTKKGEAPVTQDYELIGAITKKVTGFASNREFYSPQYTPESIDSPAPDHRTTLYWNPDINTETGKAAVSFYTADDLGYYKIIVEGVTDNGKICFGSASFMVDSYHK